MRLLLQYYSALVVAETLGKSGKAQILDLDANGGNEFTPAYAVYENGQPVRIALFNFITDPSGASSYTATISVGSATPGQVKVKYVRYVGRSYDNANIALQVPFCGIRFTEGQLHLGWPGKFVFSTPFLHSPYVTCVCHRHLAETLPPMAGLQVTWMSRLSPAAAAPAKCKFQLLLLRSCSSRTMHSPTPMEAPRRLSPPRSIRKHTTLPRWTHPSWRRQTAIKRSPTQGAALAKVGSEVEHLAWRRHYPA